MKSVLYNLSIIFSLGLFSSCSVNSKSVVGFYLLKENDVIETIRFTEDSSYVRKIYDATDCNQLFVFKGKWSLDEGDILLSDFFKGFSSSDLYKRYTKKQLDSFLGYQIFLIKKNINGKIKIEVTEFGEVVSYYEKTSSETFDCIKK